MSPRTAARLAPIACVALVAWAAAAPAAADRDARIDRQLRELKALQQEILLSGGARKLERLKSISRKKPRRIVYLFGSRLPRDRTEAFGPQGGPGAPLRLGRVSNGTPVPANVRLNAAEAFASTQSEVSIAANGRYMVAAWNDGEPSGGVQSGIGFAASTDGGRTWTDGGALPRAGGVALWISDPVLAVDPVRGHFYIAGMVIAVGPSSALAVARGGFGAGGFSWEMPRIARATRDTFPDKPWLAADPSTGDLYLSYTSVFRQGGKGSDQIELQRSTDRNETWTPAVKLSTADEDGQVQGSRPAVGPDGEVHVVWKTIDTTVAAGGLDAVRIRTSRDAGQTFGPAVDVARVFTNFCSGPAGFDRGSGLGFPTIAIDDGSGPRRGRVYVGWEESLNFYDDLIAGAGDVLEQEPNSLPATASPFVAGETIRARIDARQDVDWFRFHGLQGQTAFVYLDSLESQLDLSLRLWCGDGQTRLAYSAPVTARQRVILYTLPQSGDYLVSVAPLDDSTGSYRLGTGWAVAGPERGRDQRDVFTSHSDDGVVWSEPVRLNDGPPRYDDWLPELAVTPGGKPYAVWYDWRSGDPGGCGAASTPYLARSDDGGDSWVTVGATADTPTLWSAVFSNLSPNMGDYIAILATDDAVYPAWADGREGDPDAFLATWALPALAERVTGAGSEPADGGVRVRWAAPAEVPASATVYRRAAGTDWTPLGSVESSAEGAIEWVDAAVEPGFRYHYRLGLLTAEGEVATAEQAVDVPSAGPLRLAIERLGPNPSAGELRLEFLRPDLSPARLEILDLGGRRVFARDLGEDHGIRGAIDVGGEAGLKPGLYVVRLVQSGRAASAKVVVLR